MFMVKQLFNTHKVLFNLWKDHSCSQNSFRINYDWKWLVGTLKENVDTKTY